MWVLVVLLVALGLVAALLQRRDYDVSSEKALSDEETVVPATAEACNTCAAEGSGCYAERMIRHAANVEPLYFEDEELDAYKGTPADGYTSAQQEEFAEVLHTLRQEEVADWLHALSRRGIDLPTSLRDEAIMLMQG